MKRKLQILVLLFVSTTLKAQQNYFVYLQTDNKQPFYVKVNSKVLSSSSSGYVVIPKLTTGSYPITVGFAKDKWPEQSFNLEIGTTDAGYLLKNFGEKGWGLYNIQTMQISMNGDKEPSIAKSINDDDAFAKTLSGAANAKIDTKPKKEKVKETVKEVVKEAEKAVEPENIPEPTKQIANKVEKISSKKNNEGNRFITYIVTNKNALDTVDVFINYQIEKNSQIVENLKSTVEKPEEILVNGKEEKKPEPQKDKKFLDINMQTGSANANSTEKEVVLKSKPIVAINSDCKEKATEEDFIKTRKKMALGDNDDEMVDVARKVFKLKCYSVEQIKGLSILFLNDNGKYKFFDAVYARVSDSQNYATLQYELKDTYYINRFKAMLRN
jgi:hypothetical protein